MQIERMNKGQWGKVRAFFDLRTEEGLVIKGFKIVEGTNGPFVGNPSQKNSAGEYHDTVFADADLKEQITRVAMEAYGSDIIQGQGGYQGAPAPMAGEGPPPFDAAQDKPFGDDDIPF